MVTVLLALFILGPAITSLIQSANFRDPFRKDHLLVAEDSQLGATEITPVLAAPIRPGTNLLWCGSFQLAWNAACSLVDEDLHFNQEPPLVAALNQKPFTRADLDDASYVALAGFTQNGIHRQIEQAVRDKFQGWVRPRFIPDPKLTPRPQDFVAYACLFKDLQFPVPFERIKRPVPFGNTNVACFGFEGNNPKHEAMYPQVLVLDYQSREDFVIELKSKATGDRLLLAKVQPQATLAATVAAVKVRAAGTNTQPAKAKDVLVVPKLNFDLTRTFREIEGKRLVVKNPKFARDLVLQSAVQNTRFQMDEKGMTLRSEAHVGLACAAPPVPEHIMVFDQPFLIMMERGGAKSPYFALWVDNSELLVPW